MALLTACESQRVEHKPSPATRAISPELVVPEMASAVESFDGETNPLYLGRGWYDFRHGRKGGDGQAWVSGTATVYALRPTGSAQEAVVRLQPFAYPGAATQSVELVLNGRRLGTRELAAGWQELRWPLGSSDFVTGINTLELRFAWAVKPDAVGRRIAASGPVAAQVGLVGVVPVGAPARPQDPELARRDGHTLLLRPGGAATLLLPEAASFELTVGSVTAGSSAPELSLTVLDRAGSSRTVWSGPPAAASGLTFTLAGVAGDTLRVALGESSAAAGDDVKLDLSGFRIRLLDTHPPTDEHPPVFIYLIDTLRADVLGAYGAGYGASPSIDAFANDAVTFTEAWSGSSWTLPAVVSILTGAHPSRHGVKLMGQKLTDSAVPCLSEELQARGYQTIGVSHSPVITSQSGMDRGFAEFYEQGVFGSSTPSSELRWFVRNGLRLRPGAPPPFVYLHAMDPHAPYEPSGRDLHFTDGLTRRLPARKYDPLHFMRLGLGDSPGDIEYLRALYLGEVEYADRQFGHFVELLQSLNLYRRSLVILVADHGEEMGEHGGFDHGRTLYEELVRVPLLVKLPGNRFAGTRITRRVSTVDVTPTVLDAVGVSERPQRSLVALLDGRRTGDSIDSVFAEVVTRDAGIRHGVDLKAVCTGSLKCIRSLGPVDQFGRPAKPLEAFDLATDPHERSPLELDPSTTALCTEAFRDWAEALRTPDETLPESTLDSATRAQLRSLGYLN